MFENRLNFTTRNQLDKLDIIKVNKKQKKKQFWKDYFTDYIVKVVVESSVKGDLSKFFLQNSLEYSLIEINCWHNGNLGVHENNWACGGGKNIQAPIKELKRY